MTNSKRIAVLLGPTLMVMIASEFPLVQPHLYDEQIPPVVYLSGVLMFVAGLAIVQSHNLWQRDWTLLVTLCGWFLLAFGLFRMFAAGLYRQTSGNASSLFFMIVEGILFAIGFLMTWKAHE
jgi:uncharacterized membrane protein HdeD (DUF308 family)